MKEMQAALPILKKHLVVTVNVVPSPIVTYSATGVSTKAVLKLKGDQLELKTACSVHDYLKGEHPSYHLTSSIELMEEGDFNQTITTLGQLKKIDGKRVMRQVSIYFEYAGANPFKIVAGFS